MAAPSAAVSIAENGKYTNLVRLSPVDPWRVVRTKLRAEGKFAGPLEEGRVSGFFTAATGVCVYRGNAWPEEYRGNLLIGEAANNLVYRARLEHQGLKTISKRADEKAEFLASTDTWFRPVQLANAPDGALYLMDMYRELIETVLALPPEVLTQLNPLEGADRGRIYRIAPAGYKQPTRPTLRELPTVELVTLLEHPNGWHRDTASRLLYERQDQSAVAPLRQLAKSSTSPQGRLHALWALAGFESLEEDEVLRALADCHPRVREHAVRLAEKFAATSTRVHRELLSLVVDQDAWVRFQLAFSVGESPIANRLPVLFELQRRDGDSPWIRMAIQSSLGTGAAEYTRRVLADRDLRESTHGLAMLVALADQIGRSGKIDDISTVVKALDELAGEPDAVKSLTKSLATAFFADGRGATADELVRASDGRVKDVVNGLLSDARKTALDSKKSPAARAEATRLLACDSFSAARATIEELLDARQPQVVQEAALAALARYSEPAAATLLLDKWRGLTPRPRAIAVELLCSRPGGTTQLLAAIEHGNIAAADIDPGRIALLKAHADASIRERAAALFGKPTASSREELIARYRPALELAGDVERGRAAFRKTCSACHQLEGVGTVIGADLKAIADRGAESVLLNVLDPNREIKPQFLTYVVYTDDGRSIAGIITEETANNLTLRRPDGTPVTLSRREIEEVRSTGLSYMPEGLEQQLDMQTMADLLAYLAAVK
jgi:putative heme-binding domain-containing protein